MEIVFNPFDEDDIEMCSNCFEEEEYDFGLCVACVELAMEEMSESELTDAEALASIGWGTDEDYGYFG